MTFTVDTFFSLLESYNQAIWPTQVISYTLGILAVVLPLVKSRAGDRIISLILALFWLWTGMAFHILTFGPAGRLSYIFGAAFLFQGILFVIQGVFKSSLQFRMKLDLYGIMGGILVLYALLEYPLLGSWFGHSYPRVPVFGVAPAPVTIFTFGLLLWSEKEVPRFLIFIPFLWSLVGFAIPLSAGLWEELGLLVGGILGSLLILRKERTLVTARLIAAKKTKDEA